MKRNETTRRRAHGIELMYGGRVLVRDPQDRWHAEVQLVLQGERLDIARVELNVHDGHVLDVAAWRDFPVAAIETQVNLPHNFRLHVQHWGSVAPDDATSQGRPLKVGRYVPPAWEGQSYPDAHYQRVADVYTYHVEHGNHPAKRMSEDWGVPITSINRWTAEARRRGLLAPARSRGRAG